MHLFRVGLGALFGGRILLLGHRGRVSGLPRLVAIEVVDHDPVDGSYVVVSGFGPKAQWYQNIRANPAVAFQIGWRVRPAIAEPLTPAQGGEIMVGYAERHPIAAAKVVRFMGFQVDGGADDFRAVGEALPFVRLVPQ